MRKTLQERFWEKVERGADDECWEWKARSTQGSTMLYGNFWMGTRKYVGAHKVAYELTYGEIPTGKHVMHTCDNSRCCNPKHLILGTQADNMRDKAAKGRSHDAGRGKLNVEKALEILRLYYDEHLTARQIGLRYGVTSPMISRLVHGYHWVEAYELYWSTREIKAA